MVAEQSAAIEKMKEDIEKLKLGVIEDKKRQEEWKEETDMDLTMIKGQVEKLEEKMNKMEEKEIGLMDGLQLKFAQMET